VLPASATVVRYQSRVPVLCEASAPFSPGRLVFNLAFDNLIQVAAVSHPSLLKREDLDVRHSEILLGTF
jgi:hypothetical protein